MLKEFQFFFYNNAARFSLQKRFAHHPLRSELTLDWNVITHRQSLNLSLMRNPFGTIRLKILLGYLFVTGISAFTIWLIYSEFFVYAQNRIKVNSLNNKIVYFNSALTNLYQAETLERTYSQTGNPDVYSTYETLMDVLEIQFDSLSEMSDDALEKGHADSIVQLLKEKRHNFKNLAVNSVIENPHDFVARAIGDFKTNRDSIIGILNVRKVIEEKSESTIVEQKKRRFFERLAYAFNPKSNADSVVHLSKRQLVETDTVLKEFNPADSLMQLLTAVMDDLKKESEQNQRQMARRENIFLANDRILTVQLRQLISLLEQDILVSSLGELEALQEKIRTTTWYLITLGFLSLAIIILFLVFIMKDITRSHRYRIELEKAKAYSDSLLKSKEQFMLSITHDIKSPIASITGYARLLYDSADREKKKVYLQAITQSSNQITKLINDLFDFTKLETGKLTIESLPFNFASLMNDIFSVFNPIAADKKLDFTLKNDVPDDADYVSDPLRITQIVSNIVSNAIKYTKAGSVDIRSYTGKSAGEKDHVIIEIKDTGIGIAEEDIGNIFNEFSQINVKDRDKYDGIGLGLNIAQRLIAMLQGSISVTSNPGEGSVFSVLLPLEKAQLNKRENAELSNQRGGKKNILVLDDDEILLNLLHETLRHLDLQIFTCNSPSQALRILSMQQVDLIITDLQIPSMSGTDFIAYLQRKTGRLIPAIIMTGMDTFRPENHPEIFISACLKKPFSPEALHEAIESIFKPSSSLRLMQPGEKRTANKPQAASYNLNPLQQFTINDEESLRAILTSFVESSYKNLNSFQRYIQTNERQNLADLAHKMLAMFRQLEADELVKLLVLLEKNQQDLTDEQWQMLAKDTCIKVSQFVETLCEEQGISMMVR